MSLLRVGICHARLEGLQIHFGEIRSGLVGFRQAMSTQFGSRVWQNLGQFFQVEKRKQGERERRGNGFPLGSLSAVLVPAHTKTSSAVTCN
jgi:hypothetical protein